MLEAIFAQNGQLNPKNCAIGRVRVPSRAAVGGPVTIEPSMALSLEAELTLQPPCGYFLWFQSIYIIIISTDILKTYSNHSNQTLFAGQFPILFHVFYQFKPPYVDFPWPRLTGG